MTAAPPLPQPRAEDLVADRFTGRSALVTGGGSGIGRAVVLRLAAEGARVVAADVDEAGAEETAHLAAGLAGEVVAAALDVRRESSVAACVERAGADAPLDVLVNNAGIELLGRVDETPPDVWDEVMAVNLRGPYLVTRAAQAQLVAAAAVRGQAAIVNNASLMGQVSARGLAAYCASKAGLVSLTRSLALDLAPEGVRVNCVCPGIVHTSMLERRFELTDDRDEAYEQTRRRPPVQYLGRPEDVAAAIAYLAADESRFVTGSALTIDGGVGAE